MIRGRRYQLRHGLERGEISVLDTAEGEHPQLRMPTQRLERLDAAAGGELGVPQRTERPDRPDIRDLRDVEPEHLQSPQHLDSLDRAEADAEIEIEPPQRPRHRREIAEVPEVVCKVDAQVSQPREAGHELGQRADASGGERKVLQPRMSPAQRLLERLATLATER